MKRLATNASLCQTLAVRTNTSLFMGWQLAVMAKPVLIVERPLVRNGRSSAVTLPNEYVRLIGAKLGDSFLVELLDDGTIMLRPTRPRVDGVVLPIPDPMPAMPEEKPDRKRNASH